MNKLILKFTRVELLKLGKELIIKICIFIESELIIPKKTLTGAFITNNEGNAYYEQYFLPKLVILSGIKIMI